MSSHLLSAIRPVAGGVGAGSVHYFQRIDLSLGEGKSGGENMRLCSRDGRFVTNTNARAPEEGEEDESSLTGHTSQSSPNIYRNHLVDDRIRSRDASSNLEGGSAAASVGSRPKTPHSAPTSVTASAGEGVSEGTASGDPRLPRLKHVTVSTAEDRPRSVESGASTHSQPRRPLSAASNTSKVVSSRAL